MHNLNNSIEPEITEDTVNREFMELLLKDGPVTVVMGPNPSPLLQWLGQRIQTVIDAHAKQLDIR